MALPPNSTPNKEINKGLLQVLHTHKDTCPPSKTNPTRSAKGPTKRTQGTQKKSKITKQNQKHSNVLWGLHICLRVDHPVGTLLKHHPTVMRAHLMHSVGRDTVARDTVARPHWVHHLAVVHGLGRAHGILGQHMQPTHSIGGTSSPHVTH